MCSSDLNETREKIGAGISFLQVNCPGMEENGKKGMKGNIGTWINQQLNSVQLRDFKPVWTKLCRQLAKPLNHSIDNALTESNLSISQLVQMNEDGVKRGLESIRVTTEMRMKLVIIECLFGEENLDLSGGSVDIPGWMNLTLNNL